MTCTDCGLKDEGARSNSLRLVNSCGQADSILTFALQVLQELSLQSALHYSTIRYSRVHDCVGSNFFTNPSRKDGYRKLLKMPSLSEIEMLVEYLTRSNALLHDILNALSCESALAQIYDGLETWNTAC